MRSDLYFQGVGSGSTDYEADRRALLELTAEIEGREVDGVTSDYQRATGTMSDGSVSAQETSILKQWISERVRGSIPAGTHIVDRHRADGMHWAYALAEKPGAARRINKLYSRNLSRVRRRAVVPGLAQFEKNEPRKAWAILGAEAIGLVGWGIANRLAGDLKERRDRARRVSSYNYYDKWANRAAWGELTMSVLAFSSFTYAVLDGLFGIPPKHELLILGSGEAPQALIVMRFE